MARFFKILIIMKRIIFLTCLLTLIGCTCLPQIPPQYLPANTSCEAYIPNYLQYVQVWDNCDNTVLTQEPLPGTILDANNPYYKVTIQATDIFGNIDQEKFDVFLWDNIPPDIIWDSIPGDTIPIKYKNDIDLMFDSVDEYRAYLGADRQDKILVRRLLNQ